MERAVRAVRAAMDVEGALRAHAEAMGRGTPEHETGGELRRAWARAVAALVVSGEEKDPPRHGDDWRGIVGEFAEVHPASPKTYMAYVAAEAELPRRPRLAFFSPSGFYLAHLVACERCRGAEREGGVWAACPIHRLASLYSGARPIPREGMAPPSRPAGPPVLPRRLPVRPLDAAALRAELDVELALGTVRLLTATQAADPALCSEVAGMHIAWTTEREVPAHLAGMGTDCVMDVPAVAAAAQLRGRAEASAFMAAAGSSVPDSDEGRARLRAAFADAMVADKATKARPVPHLNRTCNVWGRSVGTLFPSVPDLIGGAAPGSVATTMDATKAFRAVRLATDGAAAQVMQCPATGRLFSPTGGAWGSNSIGAAYCAGTGLIKEIIRGEGMRVGEGDTLMEVAELGLLPAAVGEALRGLLAHRSPGVLQAQRERRIRTTGVADDIAIVTAAELAVGARDWARALTRLVGYTENLKKEQHSATFTYGGLACDLTGAAPSITLRVVKLYAFLADMAFIAAVGAAGGWVPTTWLRSAVGLMEWAAQADAGVKLRRGGIRQALVRAEALNHEWARVGGRSTAGVGAAGIVARAKEGRARSTRVIARAAVRPIAVKVSVTDHGLQAQTPSARGPGGRVVGLASDASLGSAQSSWGLLIDEGECMFAMSPRQKEASSGASEADAMLTYARRRFHTLVAGTTVVWTTDSLGCYNAFTKGQARYGSPLWRAVEETLLLAEQFAVNLMCIWVPRTCNTAADSLASRRSTQDAAEWAQRAGRALVC